MIAQGTPRTAPVVEEKVVELTNNGRSAREIAKVTGLSPRTVQRIRSRKEVSQGGYRPPLTLAQRLEIKKMLNDNASHCEIARTLGVTRQTISRWYPNSAWPNEKAYMFAAEVSAITRRARRQGVPL